MQAHLTEDLAHSQYSDVAFDKTFNVFKVVDVRLEQGQ